MNNLKPGPPSSFRPTLAATANSRHAMEEKQRRRRLLREQIPLLTFQEVRRHKIPIHEAILLELKEEQYSDSAGFLGQLLELEDGQRVKSLRKSVGALEMLTDGLKRAEVERRTGSILKEAKILLETAQKFAEGIIDLQWVADQVFLLTLEIGQDLKVDGGELEAKIHFFYGKFLLEKTDHAVEALEELLKAKKLSEPHPDWTVDEIAFKNLQKDASRLTYLCLMSLAVKFRATDEDKSLTYAKQALKIASLTLNPSSCADAHFLIGDLQSAAKQPIKAIESYRSGLLSAGVENDRHRTCLGNWKTAKLYLELNSLQNAEKYVRVLGKLAEKYDLPEFRGDAWLLQAQVLQKRENLEAAREAVTAAVETFDRVGVQDKLREAKRMEAVLRADFLLPRIVAKIYAIERAETAAEAKRQLWQLLEWKTVKNFE